MTTMAHWLLAFCMVSLFSSCVVVQDFLDTQERRNRVKNLNNHIQQYHAAASNVQLGGSKKTVLSILPEQVTLGSSAKASERFTLGKNVVDILYFRSGWEPDGKLTDNEFSPYLFIDDKLSSVGWIAIREFVNQSKRDIVN